MKLGTACEVRAGAVTCDHGDQLFLSSGCRWKQRAVSELKRTIRGEAVRKA